MAKLRPLFGLGDSLLVFVCDKKDDPPTQTGLLEIQHPLFIQKERTADDPMTVALRRMMENRTNRDDILAYFEDGHLPFESVEPIQLGETVLRTPPELGALGRTARPAWLACLIERAGRTDGLACLAGARN